MVAGQVSYLARIGTLIEQLAWTGERVVATVQGTGQFAGMTDVQRATADVLIDARIAELAAAQSFGAAAPNDHQPTVAIDDGNLVEIPSDGSRGSL